MMMAHQGERAITYGWSQSNLCTPGSHSSTEQWASLILKPNSDSGIHWRSALMSSISVLMKQLANYTDIAQMREDGTAIHV